jgi:hypothetical protein
MKKSQLRYAGGGEEEDSDNIKWRYGNVGNGSGNFMVRWLSYHQPRY